MLIRKSRDKQNCISFKNKMALPQCHARLTPTFHPLLCHPTTPILLRLPMHVPTNPFLLPSCPTPAIPTPAQLLMFWSAFSRIVWEEGRVWVMIYQHHTTNQYVGVRIRSVASQSRNDIEHTISLEIYGSVTRGEDKKRSQKDVSEIFLFIFPNN